MMPHVDNGTKVHVKYSLLKIVHFIENSMLSSRSIDLLVIFRKDFASPDLELTWSYVTNFL